MRSIFIFLFLIQSIWLIGQKAIFPLEHLGEKDGLPFGKVQAITQDSTGFIWIGSAEGLFKYDGYELSSISSVHEDSTTLSSYRIYDLALTSDNKLWISTDKGLNLMNLKTGKCRRFFHIPNDSTGLPNDMNPKLLVSKDNRLIVGTNKGLAFFNEKTSNFEKINIPGSEFGATMQMVNELFELPDGRFLVAMRNGMTCLSPDLKSAKKIDLTWIDTKKRFSDIYSDREGRIWGGTPSGLRQIDTTKWTVFKPESLPSEIARINCWLVFQDKEGHLWFNHGYDMIRWKPGQKEYHRFFKHKKNRDGLSADYTLSGFEDRSENIWLGQWGGVERINLKAKKFKTYKLRPDSEIEDPVNKITQIIQTRDSTIWYATMTGFFKTKAPGSMPDSVGGMIHLKNKQSFADGFMESAEGDLYCYFRQFANAPGFFKYNPESNSFEQVAIHPEIDKLLIFDAQVDRDDPNFWWITSTGGLCRFQPSTKDTMWLRPKTSGIKSYRKFYQSEDGIIWATGYEALKKINKKTLEVKEYMNDVADSQSIGANFSFKVVEHPRGTLWIALLPGFSKMDIATETFKNYNTQTEFPGGGVVTNMLPDSEGNLWITNRNKISKLDIEKDEFQFFTGDHGVHSKFGATNAIELKNGRFAFCGLNGLVIGEPGDFDKIPNEPPVILTDFKINDKPQKFDRITSELKKVEVSFQDRVMTFEFAAMGFIAPEQVQYAFKMEGFDHDWRYVGNQRTATYTNLRPGDYRFLAKATNSVGKWNDQNILSLDVKITPVYWQTTWFRSLIGLLTIGLTAFVFRIYNQRRRYRQQKELAERNAEYKSRFLANMSHEIRTPLNAIIGLNKLLFDTKLTEKQHEYVDAVYQSSENLLFIINDVLDQAKLESGKYAFVNRPFELDVILSQISNTFRFRTAEKGIDFRIINEVTDFNKFSGDPIRLYQILTNLVGNAFKFTDEGEVVLKVKNTILNDRNLSEPEKEKTRLYFEISDTGIGIPPGKMDAIFESFQQLGKSEQFGIQGTGLGLSIVKELIEQQTGEIQVQSELGKGSVFSFWLDFENDKTVASTAAEESIRPDLSDLTILLVEDTPFNQLLAMELLKKHIQDVKIVLAENGKVALEKVTRDNFDLILMDVKMPVMNGFEATRAIRKMPELEAIPIIALTASAIAENLKDCYDAGMNERVTKPIDADELISKIAKLTSQSI